MAKNNQKLIIIVIIALLIMTSLLAVFISLNIDGNDENPGNNNSNEPIINKEISRLKDDKEYFAVQNALNDLYDKASTNNRAEIISLLDNDYVLENNITEDNVFEKLNFSTTFTNFIAEEIYYNINSSITYYFIKGYKNEYLMGVEGEIKYTKDLYYVLVVDNNNHYMLKPLENIKNLEEYANDYDLKKVEITNDSNFNQIEITENNKLIAYITNYINLMFLDVDKAYSMLNDDLKDKYSNLNSFINDVDNINEKLFTSFYATSSKENTDNIVYKVQNHDGDTITITEYYPNDYKIGFNFVGGE